MSSLAVYLHTSPEMPDKVLTHPEDIAATLAEAGVRFERLPAVAVQAGASREELLAACAATIGQISQAQGYAGVEVLSVERKNPQREEPRAERRQDAAAAHWFVAGRGLLSLHIGERVYALQCERNDLVSTPAGAGYWFDMGEAPHVALITLSAGSHSHAASLTGDDIASRFPGLDD